LREISHFLGFDRDTARKYVRMAQKVGLEPRKPFPEPGEVISRLKALQILSYLFCGHNVRHHSLFASVAGAHEKIPPGFSFRTP
jgi:hypothetical protein